MTGWTVKDKLSYYTNVIKIKLYLMRKSSGLKKTKKDYTTNQRIHNSGAQKQGGPKPDKNTDSFSKNSNYLNNSNNTNDSNNNNKNKLKNRRVVIFVRKNFISIILCIAAAYLSYYLISELQINNIVGMIISFSISFVISYFVFSKFTFSKNLFIRFIQQAILFFVLYFLIINLCYYFDLLDPIHCDGPDNFISNNNEKKDNYNVNLSIKGELPQKPVDTILTIASNVLNKGFETLGAAGAGGTAAAAMAKASASLPPIQRLALVGGTGFVTSAGVIFGVRGGRSLCERVITYNTFLEGIKTSTHANTDVTRVPSPNPDFYINSPLELGEYSTPLSELVEVIFAYNALELILICAIIYILIYKYILNKLKKYIPTKYSNLTKIVENSINYNTKFMDIMLKVTIVLLFLFKIVNLFFSYNLHTNLDEFIIVHNVIIKKSLLITLSLNNNLLLKFNQNSSARKIKYLICLFKFKLPFIISNYLFYNLYKMVKMLYILGQFAWVKLIKKYSSETKRRAFFLILALIISQI